VGNLPELHSDYGFFRDKKGDKANTVTVLVTKDRKSKGVCALVVPRKGVGGGFAVKQYVRDVKKFGYHHKVVIRTDGEYAIRDLIDKVANLRASETVTEHTPPGDSKANGTAERAMQSIEKQCRVLKLELEEQAGKFSVMHHIFPWLVTHAADVLTKFQVHEDGLTSYERIKGRAFSGTMLVFGQCILFKVSPKVSGGEMGARWEKGMWLGKRFASDEHIISTSTGLVARSAAVKAHPELAFDSLLFDSLVGLPWDPEGKSRGRLQEVPEGGGELPRVVVPRGLDAEVPQPRGFKISRDIVERFGPTDTCRKCQALVAGDLSLTALGHSLTCRARMTELLGADPVLARRLDNMKRREDEYMERRIAAGDTSAVAKKARRREEEAVELLPGPGGVSEKREGDDIDGEPMDSDAAPPPARSRAPSTVTCVSDLPVDIDMPLPPAAEPQAAASSSSSSAQASQSKRRHEGPEGDTDRSDRDPAEPEDMEAGCAEIYMLGERKWKQNRVRGEAHPGTYDLCEPSVHLGCRLWRRVRAFVVDGPWTLVAKTR
jgi:hypothetical protein